VWEVDGAGRPANSTLTNMFGKNCAPTQCKKIRNVLMFAREKLVYTIVHTFDYSLF